MVHKTAKRKPRWDGFALRSGYVVGLDDPDVEKILDLLGNATR
jgi:hypothetical protein